MTVLMALGLAACAAEPPPPPPPPTPPERASIQNRRRPVLRARSTVPTNAAPRRQEDVPADASPRQPGQASVTSPPQEPPAETRQERDRRAFVVCRERGNGAGPGVETVAACLQSYSSTGIVPAD